MKKKTIKDIANDLNISKTAISFVLNGKGTQMGISEQSQKKILDYLEQINYIPNVSAQGLRTGKTKTIAMMVEDISDPFFSSIARVVEEIAYKKGYKILYSSTENKTERTRDLIHLYRSRQVDGYIIAPPPGVEQDIKELMDDNLAVVLFDRTLSGMHVNSILVNNFQSSYNGIRHLIRNGYRSIAMVTLVSEQVQMTDRHKGYQKAMDEIDQPYIIKNVVYHDSNADNVAVIKEFLEVNKNIDAIFFTTNYLAENGLEAIRDLKLLIPEDLAVIVFDDSRLFRLFSPPITAIAQPVMEISEQVIKLILLLLSKKSAPGAIQNKLLPAVLRIRESTRPKPGSLDSETDL